MHRSTLTLALCVAGVATLSTRSEAQQQVTSPLGYDTAEGENQFNHFTPPGASGIGRRYQQVDGGHVRNAFVVRSLGFRRNGTGTGGGTNEPPRTMDFEITMGYGDMAVVSEAFDRNFLPGSRQIVFTRKQVSMPDWTGLNGSPSPFDFNVPLDTPFAYTGPFALVIDFTHENVVYQGGGTGGSSLDRGYVGSLNSSATNLGTGCVVTGQSRAFEHDMRLENNGPGGGTHGMRMRIDGSFAPAGSPILLNIDLQDANLTVPGLCSTLHSAALISVPLGVADAGGDIERTSLSFPHSPTFVGAQLVSQFASIDPNLPLGVALSNGQQALMPSDPSALSNHCLYHWASLPNTSGLVFFGGGVVMRLGL